jgi:small subunit ribosomal protein S8
MTDPIADMLTRIRNALKTKAEKVDIPSSKIKVSIARILKEEGYIKNFKVMNDGKQGILIIYLKYDDNREPVIKEIRRLSKPSLRKYVKSDKIPLILNGFGITILSTPKGIITDKVARRLKVGGELICSIW